MFFINHPHPRKIQYLNLDSLYYLNISMQYLYSYYIHPFYYALFVKLYSTIILSFSNNHSYSSCYYYYLHLDVEKFDFYYVYLNQKHSIS